MAATLWATISTTQSDRLKHILNRTPRLLDMYFAIALHDVNSYMSVCLYRFFLYFFKDLHRPISVVCRTMFYFFFESRSSKNDPIVIWLTGGPGCSSELAVFYENGPFRIAKNMSLVLNEYGWDKGSNLLYVDQPIGTGFSYSSDRRDICHNEDRAFFKEHPQFAKNDFYMTGESYVGHYIPAFASRVHRGNKVKEGIHINLKGFTMG